MTGEHDNEVTLSVGRILANFYGPYAFGVVSLLVVWFVIVAPQLESQRVDFKQQQEVVQQLNDLSRTHAQTANTLNQASRALETTARTLERTIERLEKYTDGVRNGN